MAGLQDAERWVAVTHQFTLTPSDAIIATGLIAGGSSSRHGVRWITRSGDDAPMGKEGYNAAAVSPPEGGNYDTPEASSYTSLCTFLIAQSSISVYGLLYQQSALKGLTCQV